MFLYDVYVKYRESCPICAVKHEIKKSLCFRKQDQMMYDKYLYLLTMVMGPSVETFIA